VLYALNSPKQGPAAEAYSAPLDILVELRGQLCGGEGTEMKEREEKEK